MDSLKLLQEVGRGAVGVVHAATMGKEKVAVKMFASSATLGFRVYPKP